MAHGRGIVVRSVAGRYEVMLNARVNGRAKRVFLKQCDEKDLTAVIDEACAALNELRSKRKE